MLLVLPFSFEESTGPCRSNRFDRVLPWYDRMETSNSPWRTNPIIKEHWIQLYNDIPKQLKEDMGCKEQEDCHNLMEFNVKQGWRPLLEFLDIHDEKLAQEPFPYVNERSTLMVISKIRDILGAGLPLFAMLFLYLMFLITK